MIEQNFIENELIILTKQTIDKFLEQNNPAELISLYTFYYYTAKWQKTNIMKCTTDYVSKGLKWGEQKVRNIKKQLIEYGLIEDVAKKDEKGVVIGHYIKMNYILKTENIHTLSLPQGGNSHSVEIVTPNALSTNNINALSTNNKIHISLKDLYSYIKKHYDTYGYTSRLSKKETCKRIKTILKSTEKNKHLYPLQIMYSYACYLKEKYDSNTEAQFIKKSDSFLTSMVYDYAEKIDVLFKAQMVDKYGENWNKIKFEVIE